MCGSVDTMAAGTGDAVVTDSVLWGNKGRLSPVCLYRTAAGSCECELYW